MGKQYHLEAQIECINKNGEKITIMILFKESDQENITNHFLHNVGIGTGNIKKMKNGDVKDVFKNK